MNVIVHKQTHNSNGNYEKSVCAKNENHYYFSCVKKKLISQVKNNKLIKLWRLLTFGELRCHPMPARTSFFPLVRPLLLLHGTHTTCTRENKAIYDCARTNR